MSAARISLMGLMQYDPSILDEMVIPSAPWNMHLDGTGIVAPDKELLQAHIIRKTGNLEIMYPSLNMLKQGIRVWSLTRVYEWKKLWESMWYHYNPIWNKDGKITETVHFERDLKDEFTETIDDGKSGSGNYSKSGTDTDSRTTTNRISSFNVNGFQDRDQETIADNQTHQESGNNSYSESFDETRDNTNDATGTTDTTLERIEQGNIGVTMTQDMLQKERDLAMFSWYDVVCDEFLKEFCVAVY